MNEHATLDQATHQQTRNSTHAANRTPEKTLSALLRQEMLHKLALYREPHPPVSFYPYESRRGLPKASLEAWLDSHPGKTADVLRALGVLTLAKTVGLARQQRWRKQFPQSFPVWLVMIPWARQGAFRHLCSLAAAVLNEPSAQDAKKNGGYVKRKVCCSLHFKETHRA